MKTYMKLKKSTQDIWKINFLHENLVFPFKELLISKHGICFDQVEFERDWFVKKGYEVYTFFTPHHNHCFLVFKDSNGYNWFERTIKEHNGIHTKKSLEKLIYHYKYVQDNMNLKLYQYDNVTFGETFCDFLDEVTEKDQLGLKLMKRLADGYKK